MRYKILILFIFITLFETSVFAQKKYTFSQFADETVDFIKQPLKLEGDDYLKFGMIAVGGGLSMFADQPVRDAVLRDRQYYKSAPIEFGRMYGELYSPIILFTGFGLYSVIASDVTARKIAYEIGQASLYAGGINYILKYSVGRARPNLNLGAGTYRPFYSLFKEEYHSIPGGHSTAAFVISTVLSRNVKPVWLKILIYIPAVLTMTSRVYQDFHWASDCLIGAAFGYYIGTWVVDKHEKTDKSGIKKINHGLINRIQIQPNIMGNTFGFNLCVNLL
jgi:membrane-associated phospholipid phosphatase